MAYKILLTETSTIVGEALARAFEDLTHTLIIPEEGATYWSDESTARKYLEQVQPALVINTAALSNSIEERVQSSVLLRACVKLDLCFIHLSSYAVFNGDSNQSDALSEFDAPAPSSDSGHFLLELEKEALRAQHALVLRIPWVLDGNAGIIFKAAEKLLSSPTLDVSEAWRGTPVFVGDVVRAIVAMVQQILCGSNNWGVFHFHSSDSCSEAEFIDYIARALKRKEQAIAKITVSQTADSIFDGNAWLVGSRCTNCFGVQYRSWRQGTKGKLEGWLKNRISVDDTDK